MLAPPPLTHSPSVRYLQGFVAGWCLQGGIFGSPPLTHASLVISNVFPCAGGVPSRSPTAPEAFCALFTGLGARTCIPDGMYWRPPPLTHGFPSTFSTVSTVPNSCFQLWCHRRDGTHVFLWFCEHIILTSLLIGSEMEFWGPPPLTHGPCLSFRPPKCHHYVPHCPTALC